MNIAVWKDAASTAAISRIEATIPARLKTHPGRLSTVHIALPSSGAPTAEVRAAFAETAKRWQNITGCVAVVVEHTGFIASALRSAVTGIHLVSGAEFPMRAHRTVAEAVPWLVEMHAQTTKVQLVPSDVMQVLNAARAHCV